MRNYLVCLCLAGLAACNMTAPNTTATPDAGLYTPDAMVPATDAAPTAEEMILAHYEDDVRVFAASRQLSADWVDWMIARKNWYGPSYVRARTNKHIRIRVLYDHPIAYNPPWPSEQEHFAALKRMAELVYVGWDFDFSLATNDPNAEFTVVLGYQGPFSYDEDKTVHLIFETAFDHEFAHILNIGHHYCDCCGQDLCADAYPSGEGPCLMARNAATWGPAEQFALDLGPQRYETEANAALLAIRNRYPAGYAVSYP